MIAILENKTVKALLCADNSRRCPLLDYTGFAGGPVMALFQFLLLSSTRETRSSILLAGIDVWKISSVACGFSSIKIHYPKSLISRINEVWFFYKIFY